MVMASRAETEDLAHIRTIAVRNEHRVARVISVEHQATGVRRPCYIGRVISQESARIAATHNGYQPQALIGFISSIPGQPDLRAIG